MTRAILKSIYDRAKSITVVLALTLAFVFAGCYTSVGLTDDTHSTVTVTYGTGYYWGWYGGYYGYYPWYYWYPYYNVYPRYYVAPRHIHVPSYYEKYPQHKPPVVRPRNDGGRRDFGTTRQGVTPQRQPQQKSQPQSQPKQERRQGNRR